MELDFDKARWSSDEAGLWLSLRVTFPALAKRFVSGMKERMYTAKLAEKRQKRSLDANAYGVYTHFIVKPQAVGMLMQEYRLCRDLGEITVNGKTGHQIQAYFGSSQYDTKQMSRLIDGIVGECEDLGIETMTPGELAMLKEGWGNAQADKSA